MSGINDLRAARESYSVAWMDFIKIARINAEVLVCFFEGRDYKYYGPRLAMLNPELNWTYLVCGGKAGVLRIYDLITKHEIYEKSKVAFFIDRDFGFEAIPIDSNRMYCTPCYSVENLYISKNVFEKILEGEFELSRLPDNDGYFVHCVKLFGERLKEFLKYSELLHSWVFAQRKAEFDSRSKRRLDMKNIRLSQLFSINLNAVISTYSEFELETQTDCPSVPFETILAFVEKEMPEHEKRFFFRGKFLIFFLRNFLCELAKDARLQTPSCFPSTRKCSLQLSEVNFLSEISQYADTPDCLRRFILSLVSRP